MVRMKDATGQRFGRLMATNRAEGNGKPSWLCQCDCGKRCIVIGENLRSGNTRSCGCLRKESMRENSRKKLIDFSGEEVGSWTVLERAGSYSNGEALWRCACTNCGTIGLVRSSKLTTWSSISCGCRLGRWRLSDAD
jgi:hypothetical protein